MKVLLPPPPSLTTCCETIPQFPQTKISRLNPEYVIIDK